MLQLIQSRKTPEYVLGHSQQELQRLATQSHFFGDLTEQVFTHAGIREGMRVLDVGCGAGDVSFLAARMVGPDGLVIGVDRSDKAVETARSRANSLGIQNVSFIQSELAELSIDESVDALVGRLVLMYVANPTIVLNRLIEHVRPGGVVAFQEFDTLAFKTMPSCGVVDQCIYWIVETLRQSGADIEMGLNLYRTFVAAGLPGPEMILGGRVEGGPNSVGYEYMTDVVRTLLPHIQKFGIARLEQIQIDTLAQRMRREVVANDGVIVIPPLIGAWARKTE